MAFSFDLGLAISAERYGAISAGPEQSGGLQLFTPARHRDSTPKTARANVIFYIK